MFLAGLDIGTTGCKITVYDENGSFCGRVYQDYHVNRTLLGHEVDAAAIWAAVQQLLREISEKYQNLTGIGVTSFGETFVLLDASDAPLLPSLLYTDPRGEEDCEKLIESLGRDTIIKATGLAPAQMYSLPKLMWVKRNRPELFEKTTRICLMEDYIIYMLTGNAQIDYSLATRTMAFDVNTLVWSQTLLDVAGIDQALFSTPVPTGTCAGEIQPALAKQLGFANAPSIIAAGHDQIAAAIGSGVFCEGCAVDGAGTVECITPVFTSYNPALTAAGGYAVVPYIVPGKYVCYAFTFTGGALIKWFVDTLAGAAANEANAQNCNVYQILERNCAAKPTGLLVLPHFAGAATPYMDSGSKGAIVGLTLEHTQQDIHRANMEGVCYEMRLNIEKLDAVGIHVRELRATGGGANSRMWMQMKADVLNLPVIALTTGEAGAAGSAMMVGIACGVFHDLQQAADRMLTVRETYLPNSDMHEQYTRVYERYQKLYHAVRPLISAE